MNQSSYSYYGYYYEQDGAPGSRLVRNKRKKLGLFGKRLSSVR